MVAGHPGRLERRLDPLYQAGGPGPGCPGRPDRPNRPGWPGHARLGWPAPGGRRRRTSPRAVIAASLLAAGVVCGIAGLFPGYLSGVSLASQPANLVPHVIYLAAWAASAVAILLGGARLRAGALLGLGTSVVTFGFFFADAGQVIAGGAHLMGAGLALGLARLARVHGGSGAGAAAPAVRCPPAAGRAGPVSPGWPGWPG